MKSDVNLAVHLIFSYSSQSTIYSKPSGTMFMLHLGNWLFFQM